MKKYTKKQILMRTAYYCLGLVCLALGITLNTKTNLGMSPLVSLPSAVSQIYGLNLGNSIAVYYVLMVVIQIPLLGKKFRFWEFLQAPMSVLFTRLINFFNAGLDFSQASLAIRLVLLLFAIVFTGLGVVFTVDMDLIPNAADGMVSAISRRSGKEMGLCKNLVDLTAVILTCLTGLILIHKVICIGIGTLVTVLGTGRVVAFVNRRIRDKIRLQSGLGSWESGSHKASYS